MSSWTDLDVGEVRWSLMCVDLGAGEARFILMTFSWVVLFRGRDVMGSVGLFALYVCEDNYTVKMIASPRSSELASLQWFLCHIKHTAVENNKVRIGSQ